jgi:hypothetical protein
MDRMMDLQSDTIKRTTTKLSKMACSADFTKRQLILNALSLFLLPSSSFADADGAIECGLYMAESTIPFAGLGIFSGIDRKVGDAVGNGDICIPLYDLETHNEENFFNPFSDYVWGGEVMGMKFEVEGEDIEANCPGLDCVINCNLALINVAKATPLFDDAGLHRSKDPGAGSSTPYHNGTTTVIRDIPAGGELFKNYGNSWCVDFLSR